MAIFSYLFLYTARQKRLSPWGVFVGAVPGALPPLIGAAAVGSPLVSPLLLSTIIYIWQLPHFWFLALRYQEQYRQAGIPVFPLVYGERPTKLLILGAAVMLLPCSLFLCQLGNFSRSFALFALLSGIIFNICCYLSMFRRSSFRQGFIGSLIYLILLLLAIITDTAARLP